MENKKGINFGLLILVFILGSTLLKHFNFQTFKFKMFALDMVFLITFIIAIYIIIKDYRANKQK